MVDGVLYKLFRIPAFVDTDNGTGCDTPAYVIARVGMDRLETLEKDLAGNADGHILSDPIPFYVIDNLSLLAEELKELYELYTDPADRKQFQQSGLVSKMEEHYAAATEDVTATGNGVEMFGVLRLVVNRQDILNRAMMLNVRNRQE